MRHHLITLAGSAAAVLLAACRSDEAPETRPARPLTTEAVSPEIAIRAEDIQAHVDYLASDELAGRSARSLEAGVAAEYIAACFESYGLTPLGDAGTWFQSVSDELAPNVVALRAGSSPGYVVLTAHYDHLEPANTGEDRIFNGADDNASGTAAVLELAQAIGALEAPPTRSIVFGSFTAEEIGLLGSRYFVDNAPFPLGEVIGNINMDMVSRGEENLIFCEPGDGADHLIEATERANASVDLEIRIGDHPEWIRQSDQYPFVQKGVPAIYFGVEDHRDYHRVSDHADRILPGLAAKVARLVFEIAVSL